MCLWSAWRELFAALGSQKPLQQTGHAAPAASSLVPVKRGGFNPVLCSPKGLKKSTPAYLNVSKSTRERKC